MSGAALRRVIGATVIALLSACSHKPKQGGPPVPKPVTLIPVSGAVTDHTFVTMDHLMASVEMQLSGEPLAESIGRDLTGYSRDYPTPNIYFDPSPTATGPYEDLFGFSTAVESYEYSKQPMNNLALESGAGVSLLFGPVLNPTGATGATALKQMHDVVEHFGAGANTTTLVTWDQTMAGEMTNPLSWPGLWPTMFPFTQFDPSIQPSSNIAWLCSIASDDDPGAMNAVLNEDYECDYTTLNLPNRNQQVTSVISPGAAGWAGWKYSLWVLNYLQSMHDSGGNAIATVDPSDLPNVGTPGNMITGVPSQSGTMVAAGTYLGSSNIEGFQAQMMIEELDNAAQQWLTALTTTDGTTLSGFASIEDATNYDYMAPLRWIPSAIAVHETADASGFPLPSYSVQASDSDALQLAGLLGAYASMYSLTDRSNKDVGGSQPALVYFDGDPFPVDDQMPDGEATLHDRAVAVMKFLIVTLDRVHFDPTSGFVADDVTFTGGTPTRGTVASADVATYTLMALRQARRSLSSLLELYSNNTPDIAVASTPLDVTSFAGAAAGDTFASRLNALIDAEATLLYDHLTTEAGHAYGGWDFSKNQPTTDDNTLDAHTAAVRGLLLAYLTTGRSQYRDRAIAVFNRVDADFWDPATRVYNGTPGPMTQVTYTPRRFALVTGMLRDMIELVGVQPGHATLLTTLEGREARMNKLVLNGWDDRNDNGLVEWPDECLQVVDGIPRGGLQQAERALSGELGSVDDQISMAATRVRTTDREHDCVPDISAAGYPSALASALVLTAAPH